MSAMSPATATSEDSDTEPEAPAHVSFAEAFRVWCRVGLLSFGGPTAQVAVMHQILVEEKKWISESRFLHALNYCMLLPGPEAQQLATYLGWLLHGTRGGMAAGVLFILPGFVTIAILSLLYVHTLGAEIGITGHLLAALFFGLKPAVVAIVASAVRRITSKVLNRPLLMVIAAVSFTGIFVFEIPFPKLILLAIAFGMVGSKFFPTLIATGKDAHAAPSANGGGVLDARAQEMRRPLWMTALVLGFWLSVWFIPLLILEACLGPDSIYVEQGWLFSKSALVTFGGAYAVLPYIEKQAVDKYGWLDSSQMMDGLGMAESTPGPLIMVVQFVAFLAAYKTPGELSPIEGGLLGSIIAVWATFVPCFLFIFVGAPYVERLRSSRLLAGGLSVVTAAVVGVVLNLAVEFTLGVLFGDTGERYMTLVSPWIVARYFWPEWNTFLYANAFLLVVSLFLVLVWKRSLFVVLSISCSLGALIYIGLHWQEMMKGL